MLYTREAFEVLVAASTSGLSSAASYATGIGESPRCAILQREPKACNQNMPNDAISLAQELKQKVDGTSKSPVNQGQFHVLHML